MKKLFLFIFFLNCISSYAQVNLQTGAAQASFPLYKFSEAGSRLNTEVSLEYIYGGGLKMNEYASCVGTGWALNAGGSITRIQYGEPDDQKEYEPMEIYRDKMVVGYDANYVFPEGYLYTPVTPQSLPSPHAATVPYFTKGRPDALYKSNIEDREQDRFLFQFNGRAGEFIIGKDKTVKLISDANLKITFWEFDYAGDKSRTRIVSFTIVDEDGNTYLFKDLEYSTVFTYEKVGTGTGLMTNLVAKEVEPGMRDRIASRWLLTEIRSSGSYSVIKFKYENFMIDLPGARQVTEQIVVVGGSPRKSQQIINFRNRIYAKRLMSIELGSNKLVEFTYALDRKDMIGDKALTRMAVMRNGNLIYGYEFNYAYMGSTIMWPVTEQFDENFRKRYVRLCLTSFQKTGSGSGRLPPCEFNYVISDVPGSFISVPPVFSIRTDHWGYHSREMNGLQEASDGGLFAFYSEKIPYFNDVAPSFGVLKKIKYPEGGSLSFEYEHNQDEASPYQNKVAGGIRVFKTIRYDGEDPGKNIIKMYKYIMPDGKSSGFGFEMPRYSEQKTLRQYKMDADEGVGNNVRNLASNFVVNVVVGTAQGLVVSSLSAAFLNAGFTASLEVLIAILVIKIIDVIFGSNFEDYGLTINRADNMNLANPLPRMYSRVEVLDVIGMNGSIPLTNGKTVYEFTSNGDFPFRLGGPMSPPFSAGKQRYANWLYGHPKSVSNFDAAGNPVTKTIYEYTPIVRELSGNNNLSRSSVPNTIIVNKRTRPNEEHQFITTELYSPIQGRIELNSTTEIVYNKYGEQTQRVTNYTYNPDNFQVRTVSTVNSKGEEVGTTTYYSSDFNSGDVVSEMKRLNMLNVPLSINRWKKMSGETERKLISSQVTEYGFTSLYGDIKPVQTYHSQLSSPLGNTIANESSFSPLNLVNYPYLKPVSSTIYGDNGLPVQEVLNMGGSVNSYIYENDEKMLIAECSNATFNEIRYASFEDGELLSWTYPYQTQVDAVCPTGVKAFDLKTANITTQLNITPKTMMVSLWANSSQVQLKAGAVVINPQQGIVINGWTYYEYEIPAASNLLITISGTALVDELRLHPKLGRMKSYTYRKGVGKIAECDQNGRIIYYDYDDLGRITRILDQYGNLLKGYQYNFKQ